MFVPNQELNVKVKSIFISAPFFNLSVLFAKLNSKVLFVIVAELPKAWYPKLANDVVKDVSPIELFSSSVV